MATAIEDYLGTITSKAQTIFASTTYALGQMVEQVGDETDPFGKATLNSVYPFDDSRTAALESLPAKASFSDIGDNSPDTDITLANSYVKRTVTLPGSDLSVYTTGDEANLEKVQAYSPSTGALVDYADGIDELVSEALEQLDSLPDALTNVFTENITTHHRALWQSGFLDAVRDIATDNIQVGIEDEALSRSRTAIDFASSLILSGLNHRGFTVPAQMTGAVTTEMALLGSYMTTDIQRKIGLAAAKIAQRLLNAGVNVEQMQARFTSSVNTLEVETDKIRYAAAEAEVKGSIEVLRGSVEGLSGFIRAYMNAVELPAEWLSVEEKKLQATTQQARSWSQWTEAVTAAQKLTHAANEIHFSELDNNLQLDGIVDNLDKKKAALTTEKVTSAVRKLTAEKESELIRNAGQQEIYAAKIQKASALMKRADAELKAYIEDFTAQYTKAMSKVEGGKQLGSLSTLSGKLLGQIVNESEINVTSNKVTA